MKEMRGVDEVVIAGVEEGVAAPGPGAGEGGVVEEFGGVVAPGARGFEFFFEGSLKGGAVSNGDGGDADMDVGMAEGVDEEPAFAEAFGVEKTGGGACDVFEAAVFIEG